MTPNELERYKWLDAEEMKPRDAFENQRARLFDKLLEYVLSDD